MDYPNHPATNDAGTRYGPGDPRSLPAFDLALRDPWMMPVDAAFDTTGDAAAWFAALREGLETAYLASDDPYEQSGTSSDATSWERRRRPIVAAIHRDGAFLDVGCANGLLMETAINWAAEDGYVIEPYGMDFSEKLAELARRRYPHWAQRISVGNALTWRPARRCDFVRSNLDCVPLPRWQDFVEHQLAHVVAPEGRLIVCDYGSSRRPAPRVQDLGSILRAWGYQVAGETSAADPNGVIVTRVAWIDAKQSEP